MAIEGLLFAFSMVFLMELGDKTQLMSFTLASRYRSPLKVFGGVITGLAVVTVIGVVIGLLLKETFDLAILSPLIGVIFVLIGLLMIIKVLREAGSEEEFACSIPEARCPNHGGECLGAHECSTYIKEVLSRGAFKKSFALSFAAELGDKTMLMTVGLATRLPAEGVLVGAILALGLVNLTGIFLGDRIAKILPARVMETLGSLLFLIIGLLIMIA